MEEEANNNGDINGNSNLTDNNHPNRNMHRFIYLISDLQKVGNNDSHLAKVAARNHKIGCQNYKVAVRSASQSLGQSGYENHKVVKRMKATFLPKSF